MKEVIISVYNREYDWIKDLNDEVKVTIYRKGASILNDEIYLSNNVGRDVHTFFYHIYKNYNFLADFIFTSQDNPFDHVSNYVELINGGIDEWNNNVILRIDDCWFFNTIDKRCLSDNEFARPHHWEELNIREVWEELFETQMPETIRFVPAGHFCISKETILKRPPYFYQKIVNILETNYYAPWIIERLEAYIFDVNYQIK